MNKLFISQRHLSILQNIFKEHTPKVKVIAYGSRLNGNEYSVHSGSDLDLALIYSDDLEHEHISIYELKEIIDESNIPFLIDIFDFDKLPKYFQEEILNNNVEIFPEFRGEYV